MAQQQGNVRFVRIHGRVVPIHDNGGAPQRSKKQLQADLRASKRQGEQYDRHSMATGTIAIGYGATISALAARPTFALARNYIATAKLKKAGRAAVELAHRTGDMKAGMRAVKFAEGIQFNRAMRGVLRARSRGAGIAFGVGALLMGLGANVLHRRKQSQERRAAKQKKLRKQIAAA